MSAIEPGNDESACSWSRCTQVELIVRNHPEAVSGIFSLFSARTGSVDGILSIPAEDAGLNRIILLIGNGRRIGDIVKQLMEMDDVLDVRCCGAGPDVFIRMEEFFRSGTVWVESRGAPREE